MHTRKPVTPEWLAQFRVRRDEALHTQLQAVPNIHSAVNTLHVATAGRIAVASGADHGKVMEDTPNGARAGVAAGAIVFGYVSDGGLSDNMVAMRSVGVDYFFKDMADLPNLLAAQRS